MTIDQPLMRQNVWLIITFSSTRTNRDKNTHKQTGIQISIKANGPTKAWKMFILECIKT